MALDQDARLQRFFASAPQNDHVVQMLEIRHSAFSKAWYLWSEPYAGTVTLEPDAPAYGATVEVLCLNFEAKPAGTEGKLDQVFNIALDTTDIDDEFRAEVDAVPDDSTERIRVVFREFLFSDLHGGPGSMVPLQVEGCAFERGIATISAVSPRLNVTAGGEIYSTREVPMLREFQ